MASILDQAGIAVATMRPRIRVALSSGWRLPTMAAVAQPPVVAPVRATTMPAGTYRVTVLRPTIDSDFRFSCAGADHSFSTRLGPTASPPV